MPSNLPPGCNDRDIPGNRPEDLAFDAFVEEMDTLFDKYGVIIPDKLVNDKSIYDVLWEKINDAYNAGYHDGQVEAF